MLECPGFSVDQYNRDKQVLFNLLDELNNCVMSPKRRGSLEVSLRAVLKVLDMYEVDLR